MIICESCRKRIEKPNPKNIHQVPFLCYECLLELEKIQIQ